MSLRVLALVPQPPASASGRYRVYAMARALAPLGITMEVHPYLDEPAFQRLYRAGGVASKMLDLARGGARRWRDLAAAACYDVVFIHRELWPIVGVPALERLARRQPRWVYDFDDAVFLPNVSPSNRSFAWLKPFGQPARLTTGASAVSAGNAWLAAWARERRPGRDADTVEVVPTTVDTDAWAPRPRPGGPPRLVWIGTFSTVHYLEPLRPALARLARRHSGLELHVIGAPFTAEGITVRCHPWSLRSEHERVTDCDIGLAPLADDDWARGKCGHKLLLYMAAGLPAVAAPHGVHREIVTDGDDGLLADGVDAFEAGLDRLLGDAALRVRIGRAARARVESGYSLRAVAPRLGRLLERAAGASR